MSTPNTHRRQSKTTTPTTAPELISIRDTDVLAMLAERHGITEEAHARHALAEACHEGVHFCAAVAVGLCRSKISVGSIFLNLNPDARKRGSQAAGYAGRLPEHDACISLVGTAWERVYEDGSELAAGQDTRSGAQAAGTKWTEVYYAAEDFVEGHGRILLQVGVYLLACRRKGNAGEIATRHLWNLAEWLRPRLLPPYLPTVTEQNIRDYGRNRPEIDVLPPPGPGLRRFAAPVTFDVHGMP